MTIKYTLIHIEISFTIIINNSCVEIGSLNRIVKLITRINVFNWHFQFLKKFFSNFINYLILKNDFLKLIFKIYLPGLKIKII